MACSRRWFIGGGVLLAATARAQQSGEATFSSDVQVVSILASVRTKTGEVAGALEKEDFVVLEDGRPQSIRYFSRESDLPLTIGLMVDTSMSQLNVLNAERGASFRFLDEVLREKKDHVFVMQFDLTVQMRQPLTDSRKALNDSLALVDTPTRNQLRSQYGGGTLLFDAIADAAQDVMRKQEGRKALIVLSDGGDNGSEATLASAIEEAQRAETLIDSILFTDGGFGSGEGRRTMERLARETGGSYFEVSRKMPIDRVYALIEADLRSQYSLGFVSDRPAKGAEFRRLQLIAKKPGLAVHARERYWAWPRP